MDKKDSIKLFFETLVLKSRNFIDVKQPGAYEDITITSKDALYSSELYE
jgi:hypothetical protein